MQVVNPHVRAERRPVEAVRSVTVLGATGSVGMSTVDLLKRGNGRYTVEAVTAHKNGTQLAQIARDLNARFAVVADPSAYDELKSALAGSGIEAGCGERAGRGRAAPGRLGDGRRQRLGRVEAHARRAKRGATVALANKECMVCAGAMFMRTAAASGASVLPVDRSTTRSSRPSARARARMSTASSSRRRVARSAPGPASRCAPRRVEQALKHPNWSMGRRSPSIRPP